jgi:molecular chaperone GrpE (heat shock protein)
MKTEDPLDDFDFGFSFTEDVLETENKVEELKTTLMSDREKIEDLQKRLKKLHSSILPFLDNLCSNPEKSTIHWPNRVEKIQQYKKKLQSIVEGD